MKIPASLLLSYPLPNSFRTACAAPLQKLRIPEAKSKCYLLWVKRFERGWPYRVTLKNNHIEGEGETLASFAIGEIGRTGYLPAFSAARRLAGSYCNGASIRASLVSVRKF